MNTPWSADALNDEGPAHMVFLDSYLIDRYEVSNKQYGDFIRATGHAAPAYWDDPPLNKSEQPVVGVNWEDAQAYCGYRGKRLPTEGGGKERPVDLRPTSIHGAMSSDPAKTELWQESRRDHGGRFLSGRRQLLWCLQHGWQRL